MGHKTRGYFLKNAPRHFRHTGKQLECSEGAHIKQRWPTRNEDLGVFQQLAYKEQEDMEVSVNNA